MQKNTPFDRLWHPTLVDQGQLGIPSTWRTPTTVRVHMEGGDGDLFHADIDFSVIDRVFAVMALRPQYTFQVTTRWPERMAKYLRAGRTPRIADAMASCSMAQADDRSWALGGEVFEQVSGIIQHRRPHWPLPNLWLGVTAEDQKTADERTLRLLRCPAAKRFVNLDPLSGPVDLVQSWTRYVEQQGFCPPETLVDLNECPSCEAGENQDDHGYRCTWCDGSCFVSPRQDRIGTIDWVIAGGGSGKEAQPLHPDWARSLRNQCAAAGVPFYFTQWGEWVDLMQSPQCEAARDNGHNPGFCPIGLDGKPTCGAADRSRGEVIVYKFGPHAAGRMLDGAEHNAFPQSLPVQA